MMDFINLGERILMVQGGSKVLSIPPTVIKNLNNPTGFKIEIGMDKTVRLVPVYCLVLTAGMINLVLALNVAIAVS